MVKKMILLRFIVIGIIILVQITFAYGQPNFPNTISVLKTLYEEETKDYQTYMAYSQKALSENYPHMAYLFFTIATSESIHARNYKKILNDLGVKVKELPKPEIKVSSTKENLKKAIREELQLINQRYPQYIEKIRTEKYDVAIRYITYAWEGDREHRDLLEKIKSGTGIFFGVLVQKIEKAPIRFFICQECGFPNSEIPPVCPISKSPGSRYKEVEMIK